MSSNLNVKSNLGMFRLMDVAIGRGHEGKSIRELEEDLDNSPRHSHAIAAFALADGMIRDGLYTDAVTSLTHAVENGTGKAGSGALWNTLGICMMRIGDFQGATQALMNGRRQLIDSASTIVQKNNPKYNSEQVHDGALGLLCSMGEIIPLSNNLGCLLASLGNQSKAMEMFAQAAQAAAQHEPYLRAVDENRSTALNTTPCIRFNGQVFRDDRMFVLYACRVTERDEGDYVTATVHHENPPPNSKWALVTYKNNERYTAVRVDTFESKEEVEKYRQQLEPAVPLVSLEGTPRRPPLSFQEFDQWKKSLDLQGYDYRKVFLSEGCDPTEVVVYRK